MQFSHVHILVLQEVALDVPLTMLTVDCRLSSNQKQDKNTSLLSAKLLLKHAHRHPYPHLWLWTVGINWNNESMDTVQVASSKGCLDSAFTYRVRSSGIQEGLRVELRIKRSQMRWYGHLTRKPPGHILTVRRPRADPGYTAEIITLSQLRNTPVSS